MATKKQIAAARRNIKKAQAANRKRAGTKRKKPAAKRSSTKRRTTKRTTAKRKTTKRKNPRTAINKATSIPKGKRSGDRFTKGGKTYVVVSYMRNGKRVRFGRKI